MLGQWETKVEENWKKGRQEYNVGKTIKQYHQKFNLPLKIFQIYQFKISDILFSSLYFATVV